METKICKECSCELPLSSFEQFPEGRYRNECKTCKAQQKREIRARHKEVGHVAAEKLCSICNILKNGSEFYKKFGEASGLYHCCKVCEKEQTLIRKYGITRAEWHEMASQQCGRCLICGRIPQRLVVDHCHKTGRVRGLLCGKCNRGIGLLNDSVEILASATTYLQEASK